MLVGWEVSGGTILLLVAVSVTKEDCHAPSSRACVVCDALGGAVEAILISTVLFLDG